MSHCVHARTGKVRANTLLGSLSIVQKWNWHALPSSYLNSEHLGNVGFFTPNGSIQELPEWW